MQMRVLGHSLSFLRGYDQNTMPPIRRGDALSLRREIFRGNRGDQPAVAACLNGSRVVGRINADDASQYNLLLRDAAASGIEVNTSIRRITKDEHRRWNGSKYEYTRVDIRVEYKADERVYPQALQELSSLAALHGVRFRRYNASVRRGVHADYVDGHEPPEVVAHQRHVLAPMAENSDAREATSTSNAGKRLASVCPIDAKKSKKERKV